MPPLEMRPETGEKKKKKPSGLWTRLLSLAGLGGRAAASEAGGAAVSGVSSVASSAASGAAAAGKAASVATGGAGLASRFISSPIGMFSLVAGASVAAGVLNSQFGDPSSHTLLNQGFTTFTHAIRQMDTDEPADHTQYHAEGITLDGATGINDKVAAQKGNIPAAPSDNMARVSTGLDSYGQPVASGGLPKFADISGIVEKGGGGSGAAASGNRPTTASANAAVGAGPSGNMSRLSEQSNAAVGSRGGRSLAAGKNAHSQLDSSAALSRAGAMTSNYQTSAATAGRAFHGTTTGGGATLTPGGRVTSGGLTGAAANLAANPKTTEKDISPVQPGPPVQPNNSCSGGKPVEPSAAQAGIDPNAYATLVTVCKDQQLLITQLLWLIGTGLIALFAIEPLTKKSRLLGGIAAGLVTAALLMLVILPCIQIISEAPSLMMFALLELGAAIGITYLAWKAFSDGWDHPDKKKADDIEDSLKKGKITPEEQAQGQKLMDDVNDKKQAYANAEDRYTKAMDSTDQQIEKVEGDYAGHPKGQTASTDTTDVTNLEHTKAAEDSAFTNLQSHYGGYAQSLKQAQDFMAQHPDFKPAAPVDLSGPDPMPQQRGDLVLTYQAMASGDNPANAKVLEARAQQMQADLANSGIQMKAVRGANITSSYDGDTSAQGIRLSAAFAPATTAQSATVPVNAGISLTGMSNAVQTPMPPSATAPSNQGQPQMAPQTQPSNDAPANNNNSNSVGSSVGKAAKDATVSGVTSGIQGALKGGASSGSPGGGGSSGGGGGAGGGSGGASGGAGGSGGGSAPNTDAAAAKIKSMIGNPDWDGSGVPPGGDASALDPNAAQAANNAVPGSGASSGVGNVTDAMRDMGFDA